MRKQLSLWPTQEDSSPSLEIWQTLDQQLQRQVITALALLINKTVYPEKAKQTKGANNER